jgi:Fur family ferric uptake transcriptional regulator
MQSPTEFVETHRPAGGRRSGKRDFIVEFFVRQTSGHVAADELVDLIRGVDARISRATIYRTLQWMVDAGIARRVDFGNGRVRFEHGYRHPRHFHLVCRTCQQSFEFLSSDIEALVEEVAAARQFTPAQSVLQIYGTCESCQAGRPPVPSTLPVDVVFARDALRVAIATERSGLTFYTRAARLARDARGRAVFERLAGEEREHLGKLDARYRELLAQHPDLDAQPTFLFFKGAANGLFAAGAEELREAGVDDRQALLIGIRCERGSHLFFKRYGERFDESEGKRIFLEFAGEERDHFDLLVREYRALVARERAAAAAAAPPAARRKTAARQTGARPAAGARAASAARRRRPARRKRSA